MMLLYCSFSFFKETVVISTCDIYFRTLVFMLAGGGQKFLCQFTHFDTSFAFAPSLYAEYQVKKIYVLLMQTSSCKYMESLTLKSVLLVLHKSLQLVQTICIIYGVICTLHPSGLRQKHFVTFFSVIAYYTPTTSIGAPENILSTEFCVLLYIYALFLYSFHKKNPSITVIKQFCYKFSHPPILSYLSLLSIPSQKKF